MRTDKIPESRVSDEDVIFRLLTVLVGLKLLAAGIDAARFRADHHKAPIRSFVEDQPDAATRVPVFFRAENGAKALGPFLAVVPGAPFSGFEERVGIAVH